MHMLDLDHEVEKTWRAFQHRLAASLISLEKDDSLRVVPPRIDPDESPRLIMFRRRPTTLRVTVGDAQSRRRAQRPVELPARGIFGGDDEAAAACWAVRYVREVYGAMHPAFLRVEQRTADGGCWQPGLSEDGYGAPLTADHAVQVHQRASLCSGQQSDTGRVGTLDPRTPDELADLVERVLATIVEGPLVHDRDGDIPIVGDNGVVFVRVHRGRPVVEVSARLRTVDDVIAATVEANARNKRSALATFVVVDRMLVVRTAIWCHPFPGELLLDVIDAIMAILDDKPADA